MIPPFFPEFPGAAPSAAPGQDSPSGTATTPGRGPAAAARLAPTTGAAAADPERTSGAGHPPVPLVSDPVPGQPPSRGTEGGLSRARALAAVTTISGGQGTSSSRRAEHEEGAGPGTPVPGPAQTSLPEIEGVAAGMREGPGDPASVAGPAPATEPGGVARKANAAAPPAPAPGLRGKAAMDAVRSEKARQAKAKRTGRSRYPVKRAGDGYGPGMTRRQPGGTG